MYFVATPCPGVSCPGVCILMEYITVDMMYDSPSAARRAEAARKIWNFLPTWFFKNDAVPTCNKLKVADECRSTHSRMIDNLIARRWREQGWERLLDAGCSQAAHSTYGSMRSVLEAMLHATRYSPRRPGYSGDILRAAPAGPSAEQSRAEQSRAEPAPNKL